MLHRRKVLSTFLELGPLLRNLKLRGQAIAFSEALVLSDSSYTETPVKFWHACSLAEQVRLYIIIWKILSEVHFDFCSCFFYFAFIKGSGLYCVRVPQ